MQTEMVLCVWEQAVGVCSLIVGLVCSAVFKLLPLSWMNWQFTPLFFVPLLSPPLWFIYLFPFIIRVLLFSSVFRTHISTHHQPVPSNSPFASTMLEHTKSFLYTLINVLSAKDSLGCIETTTGTQLPLSNLNSESSSFTQMFTQ